MLTIFYYINYIFKYIIVCKVYSVKSLAMGGKSNRDTFGKRRRVTFNPLYKCMHQEFNTTKI